MQVIRLKKGLSLPIQGAPELSVHDETSRIGEVALVGEDYVGLKPTLEVKEGDSVRKGQVLFTDKKNPGVKYTSPVAARVVAISRGDKRAFLSISLAVRGGSDEVSFTAHPAGKLGVLDRKTVVDQLVDSGLWTALRARPYSKVPPPDSKPSAIFVTAMDSNPLAVPFSVGIRGYEEDFQNGLRVLSRLTDGKCYVCFAPGAEPPTPSDVSSLALAAFEGPHPSGLPGTHIHFLEPAHRGRTVWHIHYQDVIAVGKLFTTGHLWNERVVSLAGPGVKRPRLIRTLLGASLKELTKDELKPEEQRVISGSVFSGRHGKGEVAYLGRYHTQVCVLPEGHQREFLGWQGPGFTRFSVKRLFAASWIPGVRFAFTTSTHGSRRALVPVGTYDKVMPLDLVPHFLLRSLVVGDLEMAEKLGALELDEEDVALCTFVCPGKFEFGPLLRQNLTQIEKGL